MLLAFNRKGFFAGFSYASVRKAARILRIRESDIRFCGNFQEATKILKYFAEKQGLKETEIVTGKLCYWQPLRKMFILDLQKGRRWLCRSNGRTEFRDSNGKEYHYRIRQETQIVIDDEETRRLLKELGTLVFHDFHRQVTMKIDVDGALYEKSANESWKKLSRKAKLSR